jgi:16S rRNA (uracil1498-N3)-methyltransferase
MTRLYHSDDLFTDGVITLTTAQNHYLRHVLRAEVGHKLTVFNDRDGEWSAILSSSSKAGSSITLEEQVRPAVLPPELSLLFVPIKHDPLTYLVEKATELGVRHFYPVLSERSNIFRLNEDRLRSNIIDATQQCERFDIPTIYSLMPMRKTLESWDRHVPLFVCQERGEVLSITSALKSLSPLSPAAFLIGPEGGFSATEITYLQSFTFTRFVSLGPRILRAETAAIAALSCYQSLVGDWNSSLGS